MGYEEELNLISQYDKISFVPDLVSSIRYAWPDSFGFPRMLIIINGIECMLTAGIPNRVELPFYQAYCDAYALEFGEKELRSAQTDPRERTVDRDGYGTWYEEVGSEESGSDEPEIIDQQEIKNDDRRDGEEGPGTATEDGAGDADLGAASTGNGDGATA